MDTHNMDSLYVIGFPEERNKIKGSGGRYKSKGISKSLGKYLRKCLKCDKVGQYIKDCIYKNVKKSKGYKDTPYIEANTSSEGGDVYLASTSNPS